MKKEQVVIKVYKSDRIKLKKWSAVREMTIPEVIHELCKNKK